MSSDAEFFSANEGYLLGTDSNSSEENQPAISEENDGIPSQIDGIPAKNSNAALDP
jgi:hypothetical protein